MHLDQRAAALARRQRALISKRQALGLGFTDDQVAERVRYRRWEVFRRGVYVFAGSPRSWEQSVLGAVLASGDGVVTSHDTALRLFGGATVDLGVIEVSANRPRRIRAEGILAHRSLVLFVADRTVRGGIPATSPARVVVDLSGRRAPVELGAIVDDLQRRRLLRLPDLASCVARLGPAPGRSLEAVQEVLAARWAGYDPGDSDLESRILRLLAAHGLPVPRQQVRIKAAGRRYYLDLAYPEIRLAIEIDSWAFHRRRSAFDRDRVKGNELTLAGWHLLRITDSMRDDEIVGTIRRALKALGHFAVA